MRVAIVNDMLVAVECLRRALEASGKHQVAWIARDGKEGVRKSLEDPPDLILMDLFMPIMGGVEATREIMRCCPCPILIVTGDVEQHAGAAFEAMGAGALDAISTPAYDAWEPLSAARDLLSKIDTAERLYRYQNVELPAPNVVREDSEVYAEPPLVAIGASSGGPQALAELLSALPASLEAAVVVVQHVDAQFAPALAQWLGGRTELPVLTAIDGTRLQAGTVLVAATDDHVVIDEKQKLRYTPWPLEKVYRPSVDVFLQSVTRNWPKPALGILLTGMGYDGAEGLLALRKAGGMTFAQDEASCAVYGMPKAAVKCGAVEKVLPLSAMANEIVAWTAAQVERADD